MTHASSESLPWERIIADAGDALIFIDAQGVIRIWNARAAALFGFSAKLDPEFSEKFLRFIIDEVIRHHQVEQRK